MAPRTRFYRALREIENYFDNSGLRVFTKHDLSLILGKKSIDWNLPLNYKSKTFFRDLLDFLPFKRLILGSSEVFTYKDADNFDIFQKIKKSLFYSHYTAIRFHDLTEQTPYHIYLSSARVNQSIDYKIEQKLIDEYFAVKKDKKYEFIEFDKFKINMKTVVCDSVDIETKKINTENYSYFINLTNIEKTLIDAVINPDYCGGPAEVLKSFERAKDKLSATKIKSTIKRLGYKYPYHQLIGFYMEMAGFEEKKIKIIEDIGIFNDFYLVRGSNEMYSSRWRVNYPNAL